MIEPYPYVLDYGITPDTRPFVVGYTAGGVEGTLIPPTPVPHQDEVHGQKEGRPGVSGHPRVNGRLDVGADLGNPQVNLVRAGTLALLLMRAIGGSPQRRV